jgi:hypothetical protein
VTELVRSYTRADGTPMVVLRDRDTGMMWRTTRERWEATQHPVTKPGEDPPTGPMGR